MSDKKFAKDLVHQKLDSVRAGAGYWWPRLDRDEVIQGLCDRVDNPQLVWQSQAGLCGMGSFVSALAKDDPVQYVWFAVHLFKDCHSRLGHGSQNLQFKPSRELRSSPLPPPSPAPMNHADWLVLGSLRDHLNKVIPNLDSANTTDGSRWMFQVQPTTTSQERD